MKLEKIDTSKVVEGFEAIVQAFEFEKFLITDAKALAKLLNLIYDLTYPADERKYKAHHFEERILNFYAYHSKKAIRHFLHS